MFDTTLRYLNLIILPHPVSIVNTSFHEATYAHTPPTLSFRVLMYLCLKQTQNFKRMGERGTLVIDQNDGDVSPCILTTLLTQIDSSFTSQNQISQFGPIEFSTPRKPVLKANSSHERRRNPICCYSCHLADSFPANVGRFSSLMSEAILTRVFH